MSEITVIIGRSFMFASSWLRQNHKKFKLDPQQCRILTNPESLKGLSGYRIIWLQGWNHCKDPQSIRDIVLTHRAHPNRIIEELAP